MPCFFPRTESQEERPDVESYRVSWQMNELARLLLKRLVNDRLTKSRRCRSKDAENW
jgi:hypothetical protein